MTEFQSNGKHYLGVEVGNTYVDSGFKTGTSNILCIECSYMQRYGDGDVDVVNGVDEIELPDGQYSILGLASEMSEGQDDEYLRSINLNPETTLIIEKR